MVVHDRPTKNLLTIRLNESAVFLRSAGPNIRRHQNAQQPSMLRGLLVLDLVKATKVTSIEIELVAKTASSWPDATRRVDLTEEHEIFHASTIYFQAGEDHPEGLTPPHPRRTASLGPGVAFAADGHSYEPFDDDDQDAHRATRSNIQQAPTQPPPSYPDNLGRRRRRSSADGSIFQRGPFSHQEGVGLLTPPQSPPMSPTSSRPYGGFYSQSFGRRLDEGRPFTSDLEHLPHTSDSSNLLANDARHAFPNLSREPSIDRIPEGELSPPSSPMTATNGSLQAHQPPQAEPWGRKASRFSFLMVSSALMDAVRPHSPRAQTPAEHNILPNDSNTRGRSTVKGRHTDAKPIDLLGLGKFSEMLRLDGDEHKAHGEPWKEFKKGTYTYPISFTIPGNSPPSMQCRYGAVTWKLNAVVHRPGTFTSKMKTERHVIIVSYPAEEETEEDSVEVERQWDSQLQYLISISGRNFFIGGHIPFSLTLLPLTKIKIYRFIISLEERVDYYTQMKRIIRTETVNRIELLCVKHDSARRNEPILPLESDEPDALSKSPLAAFVQPEDNSSELASSFMGPGPWTFHKDLKLPTSCSLLQFTNKNRKANMTVTHSLMCVIRLTRGDDSYADAKMGKKKLFDIVVQIPVQILSCRCSPEWTALPRYTQTFDDETTPHPMRCPCENRRLAPGSNNNTTIPSDLVGIDSESSTDDSETDVIHFDNHSQPLDSMPLRNMQFERLVSGMVSEAGEAPPAYDGVAKID